MSLYDSDSDADSDADPNGYVVDMAPTPMPPARRPAPPKPPDVVATHGELSGAEQLRRMCRDYVRSALPDGSLEDSGPGAVSDFIYRPNGLVIGTPLAYATVGVRFADMRDLRRAAVRPTVDLDLRNLSPEAARVVLEALADVCPPGTRPLYAPVHAWMAGIDAQQRAQQTAQLIDDAARGDPGEAGEPPICGGCGQYAPNNCRCTREGEGNEQK